MNNLNFKVLLQIAIIYSGTCFKKSQKTDSSLRAVEGVVLTATVVGIDGFELQWDISTFSGEGQSFTIIVNEDLCKVEYDCGGTMSTICTFKSSTDPTFGVCIQDKLHPCDDVTVNVTRRKGTPEPITFNLAPDIDNLNEIEPYLFITGNIPTMTWKGPVTAVNNKCATRAIANLQVSDDWLNSNPMDVVLSGDDNNTYSWPALDDCIHGEMVGRVKYLTKKGDFDTDRKFDAINPPTYNGKGVSSVSANPSKSCALDATWVMACKGAQHYIGTMDKKEIFDVTDIEATIVDLAAGDHVVSVQAYWSAGKEELMGDKIDSNKANVPEVAPDAPTVESVAGDDTAPTKLTVTWDPPTTPICAGEVTGYTIQCGGGSSEDVGVVFTHDVTCPNACTEYEVSVAAKWSGESGEAVKIKGTTGSKAPREPTITKESITTEPDSIELRWTPSSNTNNICPLSGYTVKWLTSGDGDGTHDIEGEVTTYTIPDLTCNKHYTVTVIATATDGKQSNPSTDEVIKTDDKVPGNTTDNSLSPGNATTKLDVTWTGPTDYNCAGGLGKYKVTWTADEGDNSKDGAADVVDSPYTIVGLHHCTPYTVSVQARSNTGTLGPEGDTKIETTTADPPGPPAIEEENIKPGTESITLSWSSSDTSKSCQLIGYTVNWTPAEGDGNGIHDAGLSTTNTITGLICNKDYTVKVTATAEDNSGSPADEVVTKTDDTAPEQVNDVLLVAGSPTELTASWIEPTYACKGSTLGPYKVTWTPEGGTATVDEDGTSSTISDLVPCTTYTVNVAATSNTGITGNMGSNTIKLPNEVPGKSNVTNGDITPHSLKVEWIAPSKVPPNGNNCPITNYIVQCANDSGNVMYEHTIMDPKQLSDTFTDLEACTKYNITVIAYTEKGGNDGDTVSMETGTNAPPVDAVSITPASKSAHITWDRPSDTNCELVYEVTYTGTTMWTNNKTDDEGGLDPIDNPDTTVSADLDKLLAYTSYEICVTVRTGNTTCNTTETEMEVPTAPRNIAVKEGSISEVSLALTWEYPEAENGILLEYWVYWELEGESSNNYTDSVTANNTSYTISDLDEGTYIFKVIAVNSKGNSLWSDKIEQWMDGPSPACGGGCIAGIVIGILLVALIIPAFIFRDRIKEKIIPGSPPVEESPYELRGAAILKTDFRQHVEQLGLDRAESAYQMLNDESQQKDKFAATKPFNKGKNRFANIHPFDQTRVKLPLIRNGPKGSDYINANHITFPDTFELEFIATQGPLDSTINDFWRMIWEHNVYDTVMLCNLFEKGKSKCAQYWTENGERSMEFGDFKISCQAEEEDMSKTFITRYIDVVKDGQHRMVKQHHFLAWPDFGVPENEEGLLRFLSFVQKNVNQHGKKVLTHCSAGVGRTGTFIALWVLTSLLEKNKAAKSIDVHKIALMMREGRSDMIQTKDQYLYLHKCLLKYMEDAGNSFLISNKDEEEPIYGNVNTGFQQ